MDTKNAAHPPRRILPSTCAPSEMVLLHNQGLRDLLWEGNTSCNGSNLKRVETPGPSENHSHLGCLVLSWTMVLLLSTGWPWTYHLPASSSKVLSLTTHPAPSGLLISGLWEDEARSSEINLSSPWKILLSSVVSHVARWLCQLTGSFLMLTLRLKLIVLWKSVLNVSGFMQYLRFRKSWVKTLWVKPWRIYFIINYCTPEHMCVCSAIYIYSWHWKRSKEST